MLAALAAAPPAGVAQDDVVVADWIDLSPYRRFLERLQEAIRHNRRERVAAMVAYPLRVNRAGGGTRYYDNRAALLRDYDEIFTAAVRRAVIEQRPNRLFRSYRGAMAGDGAVWFEALCLDKRCRRSRPIRIFAVNR
jgi:hypothetical protein